jgi:RimJ/RimL family protein N-acetyltransferase
MNIDLQPTLTSNLVSLQPLQENDFDTLYEVASDPKIWEQHPNKNRWQKDVFKNFFNGAIQSKGAFKIIDQSLGHVIGCTRFYDFDEEKSSILIGYTFFGLNYWGKGFNLTVKKMMLDYIFQFVKTVHFHVGAHNLRSQIAIGRLGALKIAEQEVTYFGETPKLNFVYEIKKEDHQKLK